MRENELFPCRFCGTLPALQTRETKWGEEYGILCEKCFHMASPTFMLDLYKLKNAWQARNEKHNPFIPEKIEYKDCTDGKCLKIWCKTCFMPLSNSEPIPIDERKYSKITIDDIKRKT